MKRRTQAAILCLALLAAPALASERHFTFSYESSVLGEGEKELETYSDFKFGRDLYYSALDERLELEWGLGGGVQSSLYLNFEQEMADDGTGAIGTEFLADGISNEWKFKLSDRWTEALGLGLYFENGFKPDEYELETKVIVDKQMGDFLWTFNLTAEPEVHFIDNTVGFSLTPSAGAGFFLVPEKFFVGIEAQYLNAWEDLDQGKTASMISAGPVLAYTGKGWWAAVTYLPQLANLQGSGLDYGNGQRHQVQVAFSLELGGSPERPAASASVPAEFQAGRSLYEARCQECHKLHDPGEFTPESWDAIMTKMKYKANLEGDEEGSILGYLKAFAKKG
ncbi:MAG TPA: hypothetical protein VHE12_11575 [bacterium]|nr:hypothetical protein [bacterium]